MSFLKKLFGRDDSPQQSNDLDAGARQSANKKQQSNNSKANQRPDQDRAKKSGGHSKKASKKEAPPEVVSLPKDFAVLNLPLPLQQAIQKLGFQSCTPVQNEVLPHSLDGADIIAQAQTGTGKTAAFLLSVITYHLENPEHEKRPAGAPFSLVIAPTRETRDANRKRRRTTL